MDIRESTKIGYEAKAVMLCYNEVGIRGEQAAIYWTDPEVNQKMPIFEIHVGKNKYGSYKGRIFMEFHPSLSSFVEVPEAASIRYSQMMSGG